MNKIIIPVLASILILGTLGLTPNAYAANGEVIWINPPENHGKIRDDQTGDVLNFRIPQDVALGYSPQEGDQVTFTIGNGKTASDVTPVVEPPSVPFIEPTSGIVGQPFTITDPQGRIFAGDVAVFYEEGTDPGAGTIASNNIVNPDGTLTGNVPGISGGDFFVNVRPSAGGDSRFADLSFTVE